MKSGGKEAEESRPIQVIDLDISTPIDVKKGVEQLGGNPMLFYMMLEKFEGMNFMSTLQDLARDVENQDYLNFKTNAHSIKGSAGYICASRLHYACYFI